MPGQVVSSLADSVRVSGLDDVAYGDLCEIDDVGGAIVTMLGRDHVELAPLVAGAAIGAQVRRLGSLTVPIAQVGQTVDPLGHPLDGSPAADRRIAVFARDRVVFPPAHTPRLTFGTLVFDLQHVYHAGGSVLAAGSADVLHHVLRHQAFDGRVVVLATPAGVPEALRRGDLRCIQVVAPPGATAFASWLVPWTAMAIADGLRRRNSHVVVAVDLDAWRPHVRHAPLRGGWPTQLAALSSRAYAIADGSVTLIGLTGEVDPIRASAFDIVLDLDAALRGELPRTGTSLVRPPIQIARRGRFGAAIYPASQVSELESVVARKPLDRFGSAMLDEGRRLRECFRVRAGSSVDPLEQELCLLAVLAHPELPASKVGAFVAAYGIRLRDHAGRMAAVRRVRELEHDDEQVFLALAAEVIRSV